MSGFKITHFTYLNEFIYKETHIVFHKWKIKSITINKGMKL